MKKHPVRKTKSWTRRWYNQICENPSVFSAGFILWLLDQPQLTLLLHSSIFMESCQHTAPYKIQDKTQSLSCPIFQERKRWKFWYKFQYKEQVVTILSTGEVNAVLFFSLVALQNYNCGSLDDYFFNLFWKWGICNSERLIFIKTTFKFQFFFFNIKWFVLVYFLLFFLIVLSLFNLMLNNCYPTSQLHISWFNIYVLNYYNWLQLYTKVSI